MQPRYWFARVLCTALLAFVASAHGAGSASAQVASAGEGPAGPLRVTSQAGATSVLFVRPDRSEVLLRATRATVANERYVAVEGAGVAFAKWDEDAFGRREHRVSVTRDGGASWSRAQTFDETIPLRAGRLIPRVFSPDLPPGFRAGEDDRLFIVQFETPGLEAWRSGLRALGAEVLSHLPHHAQVVRMDGALAPLVAAQPYVRWVGPYEPGYKIEPEVLAEVGSGTAPVRRYHLMTFTPGPTEKSLLADEVRAAGGRVDREVPDGYRLEATLSGGQIARMARSEHLLWLDRFSPPEQDMNIVRTQCGADVLEGVPGYSGQGVRGEVMDAGIEQSHMDFDGIQIHGPGASLDSHGTSTFGIVFGNGDRDGDGQAQGTGHLPRKEAGWFFDYDNLVNRYQETAELVSSPIYGVFQSNSWGDARTRAYTSISSEMDDIIWQYDVAIFQSQSNAGNQDSRPQAWAKNVFSIGAVNHYGTPALSDDCWCFTGSIGPAEDGRIKPDLSYWYDSIYTTTTGNGYTAGFGGTSAATPVSAGIGGLILQMWADNVLGNEPQGSTVFEKRPHAATLKALMINTAEPYPFSGTGHDLARSHQGWGLPSAKRFYDRAPLLKVVNEEHVLQELDTHTYTADVPPGQLELKITLVYTDRAGTTSSTLHRINDVTLKVTDPSGGVVYWGNAGLEAGNWSTPGGGPDGKNTVENVFVQGPAPGLWTFEVSADDLNQDEHIETPEVDQDYALAVYGVNTLDFGCAVPPPPPTDLTAVPNGDNRVDLAWTGTPDSRGYRVYRSAGGCAAGATFLASVPVEQTTFTDTAASGGSLYGYSIRSVEGCESAPTSCVELVPTGPCILPPAFAGLATAAGDDALACGVTLSWPAASPSCGGPVAYSVYRGITPNFVPTPANRVASCMPGTSWHDTLGLSTDTVYYWTVRAEDLGGRGSAACGGAPEGNVVQKSALVRGPAGTLLDTGFETGLEGWAAALGSPPANRGAFVADLPTGTFDGAQPANPGTCAAGARCLYTEKNKGSNAGNGDVDGGQVLATSPAFDAGAFATARLTLARWHYNSAPISDAGDHFALDVSNDGGASWTALETLGPRTSANTWTNVAFDLQAFRPLTAQMRLRVRSADGPLSDATVESAIDAVRIQGDRICTSPASRAPGAVPEDSLRVDKEEGRVTLSWSPECGGGTGYGVYQGDLETGYDSALPVPGYCGVGTNRATFDPGPGSVFFLVAPNDGMTEGSLGTRSDGSRRPQPPVACFPRAATLDACAP